MTAERPEPPQRPRRVAVIGMSGAGKTTIAQALAARLDVRHIELDALFWRPGWQEPDRDVFRADVIRALDEPGGWVLDGNYSTIRDAVLERADTMVWLDLPMRTCLWRVTRRAVQRARMRELLWGTNREPWRNVVGRNSLAWWVITNHGRRRRETEERFRDPALAGVRVERFRSSKAAEAWVASV
jgi:adenylate kinase family enzyme